MRHSTLTNQCLYFEPNSRPFIAEVVKRLSIDSLITKYIAGTYSRLYDNECLLLTASSSDKQ